MKQIFLVFIIIFAFSRPAYTQDIPIIPILEGYKASPAVEGDLDHDGIGELALYYTALESEDLASSERPPRITIIYKLENNEWKIWKTSQHAVHIGSDSISLALFEIIEGELLINHEGGRRGNFAISEKYSFYKDDLYLSSYNFLTSSDGPCGLWRREKFEPLSGSLSISEEYLPCEGDDATWDRPLINDSVTGGKQTLIPFEKMYEEDFTIKLSDQEGAALKIYSQ